MEIATDSPIFKLSNMEEILEIHNVPTKKRTLFIEFYNYLKNLTDSEVELFKRKGRLVFKKKEVYNYTQKELTNIMFGLYEGGYRV